MSPKLIFNHKGHKGFTQRSQRAAIQYSSFVSSVPSLSTLWLMDLDTISKKN